jgi:hypothetical protein
MRASFISILGLLLPLAVPPSARAQAQDGIGLLVQRMEQAVAGGDEAAYRELFATSVSPERADAMAADTIATGVTRAVVRERDRAEILGSGGNAYRLVVELFTERGAQARVWTLRVEVSRQPSPPPSEAIPDTWLITGQERLTSVDGLYRLSLDPATQLDATDLVISAEDVELRMSRGSVFVARAGTGVTALVLLGDGLMRFTPKPQAERGQVRIFCGKEVLEAPFSAAFVRLNPGTMDDHVRAAALTERAVDASRFRQATAVFAVEIVKSFGLDLSDLSRDTWSLVPGYGDFLAEVRTRRHGTLTYARSSFEAEDISLFDRARRRNISVYASERKIQSRGRFYDEDQLVDYDVLSYDIDAAYEPQREWLDGRVRMQIKVRSFALTTLTVRLAEALVVRSIVSDRHGRLLSFRVRNQNSVLVSLPASVARDDVVTLTVAYAGRLPSVTPEREVTGVDRDQSASGQLMAEGPFVPPEPRFIHSNRSYWYPQSPVSDYATAHLRLTVPEGWHSVASGDPAPDNPERLPPPQPGAPALNRFTFVAGQPVRYMGWLITRLEPSATSAVSLPATAVLAAARGADGQPPPPGPATGVFYDAIDVRVVANPRQVSRGRTVLPQVAEILELYGSILDDLPYPSFTLALVDAELPGGHSPPYFALLNQPLPTSPFVWRNDPVYFDSFPQFFLAHELAHQFWGHAVGWKNYHEQWISEGFAQYFAALYAQHRRGPDVFRDILRTMGKTAIDQSPQGPISLGYRLGHVKGDSRVFRALVYNKGALVLHMLRRLVGDGPFFTGLRDLYAAFRFRKAGTEDVRLAFERASGRSLERFFEQWIHGSGIPRLTFRSRVEPSPEGTGQVVRLSFDQAGEPFEVPVTVKLVYRSGEEQELVVPVAGASTERTVPLKGPLRRIQVNDDGAAVARIDRR